MSVATVKAHVSRLLTKLELNNRVQIARLAHDAGVAERPASDWPSLRSRTRAWQIARLRPPRDRRFSGGRSTPGESAVFTCEQE
jgi:hypothetical protein